MIIKKFQANTETEAIMLAKEDLGKDAIVMNIKTISPKGFFKLFKKPSVEITAAVDEYLSQKTETKLKGASNASQNKNSNKNERMSKSFVENIKSIEEQEIRRAILEKAESSAIELKLNNLQSLLEKQLAKENVAEGSLKDDLAEQEEDNNIACVQLVYNQLIANEVDEKYANQILGEIDSSLKKDSTIDAILASMYQKLILKLGQTKTLEQNNGKTKYIFFVGPTGVGKTTTIAKISSNIKVEKKGKIAFITSDTYRIAAVEQLRTYASILDIPIRVIYSDSEFAEIMEDFKSFDYVFVDTAGRSHKSIEQRNEVEKLINHVPENEREVYLVLSATTKYKDLIKITEAYSGLENYRLIFTKLDETSCIGNIFNIKLYTGAPLSYATFGQNVPDDIARIDAQNIAKQLLGGNE